MLKEINIDDIINITLDAGKVILEIYNQDFVVEYKDDESPLTIADKKGHEIISKGLNLLSNVLPILSEEGSKISYGERKNWPYFWLVDPLDGTKEFIKRNGDFTVNIALIHKGYPILGVVYAPVLGDLYYAKQGEGSFLEKVKDNQRTLVKQPLPIQKNSPEDFVVVASKSHLSSETQAFIDDLSLIFPKLTTQSKGSSLKLCMVAEGAADVYPRLAPTMEWDTAAADAIVREAGKMTYQYQDTATQNPLVYNKENLLNPWFIVKGEY